MGKKTKSSSDLSCVLWEDGVRVDDLHKYENCSVVNLQDLRDDLGMGSWAVRIAYNDLFGGVVIQQQPGEGNRRHLHRDADENWIILDGEWEWWIEGAGARRVKVNDIIVVPSGTRHQITCVGNSPGVRYAVTRPDVEHVYEEE